MAEGYPEPLASTMKVLKDMGWQFYVVDNARRGRAHGGNKSITVPSWAMGKDKERPGFFLWYVAHEVAHAVNTEVDWVRGMPFISHGPLFMYRLMQICPREHQHFELEYKPRLAEAAGIRKEDV